MILVDITDKASLQLHELASWWARHRADSRHQVFEEFERVIARLEENPDSGTPDQDIDEIQWLQLEGTPYKIYYDYQPESEIVTIHAVWSGMRGKKPPVR